MYLLIVRCVQQEAGWDGYQFHGKSNDKDIDEHDRLSEFWAEGENHELPSERVRYSEHDKSCSSEVAEVLRQFLFGDLPLVHGSRNNRKECAGEREHSHVPYIYVADRWCVQSDLRHVGQQ